MTKLKLRRIILISFAGIILVVAVYNLWAYQGTLLSPFMVNAETDSPHQPLAEVLKARNLRAPVPQLWLEVIKSQHRLTVYSGETSLKSYQVSLGRDYMEDKVSARDKRTPEGSFIITEATKFSPPVRFLGSRLLLLNYPNRDSAVIGLREGILTGKDFLAIEKAAAENTTPPQNTPMGGGISIHGGGGPFMGDSWTDGSIALYSKDMEELFQFVQVGAKVVIKK